ncbi:MAG: sulfatase-like hydrolase/transferase, partial [Vicinamibacterales bacterium]
MARALALLAVVGLLTSCTRATAPHLAESYPRLIVLVTIDTLRADRLGAYGSTAGLTPNLDRFAEHAVRFAAAVTQVPLTLPAHATILTGLHPARHGIRTNDGFQLADVRTLADALQARGYATGAFIGGYPLRASSGLARGFDRYD